jgi:hypothetical protein
MPWQKRCRPCGSGRLQVRGREGGTLPGVDTNRAALTPPNRPDCHCDGKQPGMRSTALSTNSPTLVKSDSKNTRPVMRPIKNATTQCSSSNAGLRTAAAGGQGGWQQAGSQSQSAEGHCLASTAKHNIRQAGTH